MVAVTATIEELKWKCNETLEIVMCWMKAHGLNWPREKRGCSRNIEKKG